MERSLLVLYCCAQLLFSEYALATPKETIAVVAKPVDPEPLLVSSIVPLPLFDPDQKKEPNWQEILGFAVDDTRKKRELVQKSPHLESSILPWDSRREDLVSFPRSREPRFEGDLSLPQEWFPSWAGMTHALEQREDNPKQGKRLVKAADLKALPVLAESDTGVPINLPPTTGDYLSNVLVARDQEGRKITIKLTHFEPEIYKLAYDVFVLNGDVEFAYQVARVAVDHEQTSVPWRKKLADVSLWSGHAEVALQQWMYFITHGIDANVYREKALVLAGQLNDYDSQAVILRQEIQEQPGNQDLMLRYALVLQQQGYPKHAMTFVQGLPSAMQDKKALVVLATIAKNMDDPNLELYYLQKVTAIDPLDVKMQMQEASVYYSQGNFAKAQSIFDSLADKANPKDIEFWKAYAGMSDISAHPAPLIRAYHYLLSHNELDKSAFLQLIYLEESTGKTEAAYKDAKIAYARYHDLTLAKALLGLGSNLNQWQEVKQVLDGLSAMELQALQNEPDYAMLIASIYGHLNNMVAAFQQWETILQRWPTKGAVQQGYLWFLIDNDDRKQLEYTLRRWCRLIEANAEDWAVYATALTNVGEYPRALNLLLRHPQEVNKSFRLLLDVANLFVQNNNDYAAYYLQRRAFYLLLNEISAQGSSPMSLVQSLAMAELLRAFAPASASYNFIRYLSEKYPGVSEVNRQVIAMALENKSYSLARIMMRAERIQGLNTPPWMQLTLALEENDTDWIRAILFDAPKILPHRDRVTAALRTGNIKLGEQYAYQGLSEHPKDNEMYDLFTDTMLPRSDKVSLGLGYQDYGIVAGALPGLSGRFFVTPSVALLPYTVAWLPKSKAPNLITNVPTLDGMVGLRVRKYIEHGWVQANIAENHSLKSFFGLSGTWYRQNLVHKLDVFFSLDLHQQADETTTLLLGGMKNDADLILHYYTDSRNLYDFQTQIGQFLGQDGSHLGTGEEIYAHWRHKFYLSYPDWNINLYGSSLNYQNRQGVALSPLLQRLVPPGGGSGIGFYMPVNDLTAALTFGFGQEYAVENYFGYVRREDIDIYSHAVRPYAEAGVGYSRAFGWGPIVQAGLAASIFGRDHLALYGQYEQNQQQVNQVGNGQQPSNQQGAQTYYIIGMRYDYYF